MNERIRELAEQAKAESSQWLGSKPATTITYDELEKFAELIVQETIDELLQQFWNYGVHGGNEVRNPTFHYAIKRTKEHFGVEE